MKAKNIFIMFLFSALLGAVIGGVIWAFMRMMEFGIELLWQRLPGCFEGADWLWLYPLLICLIGGLLIGLGQKKWGPCPESLQEVMATVKKRKAL